MTLSSTTSRAAYVGNGSTTEFSVPFLFADNSHIVATLRGGDGAEIAWAENTHYSLAGAGEPGGGTLTALVPPAAGQTLVIRRVVPLTQETDYVENDPFPAEAHERALDLAAMRDQQMQEQLDRTLRFPVTDTIPLPSLPSFSNRANKALGFDSLGNPTLLAGTEADIDTVTAAGGTTARTLAEHFGDVVNVRDFGTVANGVTDNWAAIQAAIDRAAEIGGGVVQFPAGVFAYSGTLTLPDDVILQGAGMRATELKALSAARMIETLGSYGASATYRGMGLQNLTLNGGGVATEGWRIKSASGVLIDNAEFRNIAGIFLYLDQVWDSHVSRARFQDVPSGLDGAVVISYGSGDNSNQVHWRECVWETYQSPALKVVSGSSGTEKINEIFFTDCKWESVHVVDHVVLNDFRTFYFVNCTWTMARTNSGTAKYGVKMSDGAGMRFVNCFAEWFQTGSNEHPWVSIVEAEDISFINCIAYGANNGAPVLPGSGAADITAIGCVLNSDPVLAFVNASYGGKFNNIQGRVSVVTTSTEPYFELRRTDILKAWHLGRIGSDGFFNFLEDETRRAFFRAGGEFNTLFGLRAGAAWNGGNLFRFDNYRIWIDSSGRMRILNGIPSSDTDGTVVGTQS